MPVPRKSSDRGSRNYHQACLKPESGLEAIRPSTAHGTTVIRLIPEVAHDGTIQPMVKSITPMGPDLANYQPESVVIGAGSYTKFNGLGRSSNGGATEDTEVNQIFPGIFIRIRGRQKKGQLPAAHKEAIEELMEGGWKAALKSVPEMGLFQCIAFKFNNQTLDKPAPRKVAFMTTTGVEEISRLAQECAEKGIDITSPEKGYQIILEPEEQRGTGVMLYKASLGDPFPLKEEFCKKAWVPWEQALNRLPREEHISMACNCFGREIVEIAFPEEVKRVMGPDYASAPASSPAPASVAVREAPELPDHMPGEEPAGAPVDIDLDSVSSIDGGGEVGTEAPRPDPAPVETSGTGAADPQDLVAKYQAMLDEEIE